VIAAVLLLHERSVEETVPQLSRLELEKVIELVGRSPRLYPRGILEALHLQRSLLASPQPGESLSPNDANQMRQAHERRLAMLGAHTHNKSAPERPACRPFRRGSWRRFAEVAGRISVGWQCSVRTPTTRAHRSGRPADRIEHTPHESAMAASALERQVDRLCSISWRARI